MRIEKTHDWNLTPREAIALQERLREKVIARDDFGRVELVAGADAAFDKKAGLAFGAVVVFEFPSMREVERKAAARKLEFPYAPGLLSFREIPVLLDAFAKLEHGLDLIMFDGQGLAHPRRFGLACHAGVLLDIPSIGCAKSRLTGKAEEPGRERGEWSPLRDKDDVVGAVLRTRRGVKPVYISIGHRVSLDAALKFATACCDGLRIPVPTRAADRYVSEFKRSGV